MEKNNQRILDLMSSYKLLQMTIIKFKGDDLK